MNNDIRYTHDVDGLQFMMEQSHGAAFRKKIDPCPFCQKSVEMFQEPEPKFDWISEENVVEIVFVRDVNQFWKRGMAIVISKCPRCGKLSFHHQDISYLSRRDWLDRDIIEKEILECRAMSLNEWNNSLCSRCIIEKEVDRDDFGYWVKCSVGKNCPLQMPDEPTTFRCDNYIPQVPNTCFVCGEVFIDDKHPENMHVECAKKIKEIDRIAYEEWVEDMKKLGWK
jgi:hypothetical protein